VERIPRVSSACLSWALLEGAEHFGLRRLSRWRRYVEDSVSEILTATSHEEAPNKGTV
jgi:hypothetical protein